MIKNLLRYDFKTVDKNDEIGKVLGYFYEGGDFPIVMDGKKPWGIVDARRLLRRKLSINEKVEHFTVGVPTIDASYSIQKARQVMLKSGQPFLLVTYEGKLLGYITAIDVATQLGNRAAGDIMRYVEPINENATVANAISTLRRNNTFVLPVTSGSRFIGVIRVRDVIRIETTHDKKTDYHPEKTSPLDMQIKGIVETDIRVVEPSAKEEIVKIVDKQGFAIVCKGEEYKGLIELIDLIR